LAVDDLKAFHTENLKKEWNRADYTYMARVTKGSVVTYFQTKGARVHFNHMTLDDPVMELMTKGENKQIKLRYGVIEYDDMVRDMRLWETLLSASFMQRPHEILTENTTDEMLEAQERNLSSALAFAALTVKPDSSEADLYETIVGIPHYQ
jgi:hypothetical protein